MSQAVVSCELESLLTACVEDGCDELQLRRIDELIRKDTAALAAYLDMMGIHAMLQWRFGLQSEAPCSTILLAWPRMFPPGRRAAGD